MALFCVAIRRDSVLSISLSTFHVCSEYLARRTTQVFIPLMCDLQQNLFSKNFLVHLKYSSILGGCFFVFFGGVPFFHLCLFHGVSFQYSRVLVCFLFSKRSDFFLI